MKTSASTTTSANGRNSFAFLIVYLTGLSAFGSFVNDMYLPSLPSMTHFFGCSVPSVEMGLTSGMAGLAIGELFLGPMSDRYGRKPILLWTLVLFCAAAVVSIFSPTIEFFVGCRFFQGLGASGGYFLARTIPADIYAGRSLARIMATVGAINGFAPACAPVVGALICDHWEWKGVFVVLTVFGLILLLGWHTLKETHPASQRQGLSLRKAFSGYRTLLADRRFIAFALLKGSALGILFTYISSAPFIIQTHYHFSQTQFGLIVGGNALLVAVGSMAALKFKQLVRAGFVGALGLVATVAALVFVLFVVDRFIAYELLLLPMMFFLGMIFTAGNTLAMNEGRSNAGAASAIVGMAGYVFGATVSPLVGIGDILHSTAIVLTVVAAIVLVSALFTRHVAAG